MFREFLELVQQVQGLARCQFIGVDTVEGIHQRVILSGDEQVDLPVFAVSALNAIVHRSGFQLLENPAAVVQDGLGYARKRRYL